MHAEIRVSGGRAIRSPRLLARLAFALALCATAAGTHAASIYKCMDAHGNPAYRDTPCAPHSDQGKIDVQPLPTIGDPGEVAARTPPARMATAGHAPRNDKRPRAARSTQRRTDAKTETSWECRATNGEVFYRHARCPSSVPGDGVARSGHAEKTSGSRTRGRNDAWSRVPVHGTKIPRAEACRRIQSAGAAGRDGHARDENVPAYDHLMGRGPCDGT